MYVDKSDIHKRIAEGGNDCHGDGEKQFRNEISFSNSDWMKLVLGQLKWGLTLRCSLWHLYSDMHIAVCINLE